MPDWLPLRQFPLRIASDERSIAIPSLLKWAMDDMTLEIWVASTEGESTISVFLPEHSGHRGSGPPSESPEAVSNFDVVLTQKRVCLKHFIILGRLDCHFWNWSLEYLNIVGMVAGKLAWRPRRNFRVNPLIVSSQDADAIGTLNFTIKKVKHVLT